MKDADMYSLSALEKESTIRNYERSTNHGVTKIKYDLVDRALGMGIGAATTSGVGWIGKFGLVLASTAVPIAGPVLAGIVIGTTLGAPIVGAAAGAAIGKEVHKEHYFDDTTGRFLGNDRNTAAEKANEMGEEMMKKNNFTAATAWFSKAYQTCSRSYKNEQKFKDRLNFAKAEALNKEGEDLMSQGHYDRAEAKLNEAYNECPASESAGLTKIKNNRTKLYNLQGAKLWNEAWLAEENDRPETASAKFLAAKTKFSQAGNGRLVGIVGLKIEGNELFNQGLEFHEQANRLKQQQRYDDCLRIYQESMAKFQQGYNSSHDERFNDCIELVEESITRIREATNSIERHGLNIMFSQLTPRVNQSEDFCETTRSEACAFVGVID